MYGKALREFLSQSHPSEEDHLPQEQAFVSMVTLQLGTQLRISKSSNWAIGNYIWQGVKEH